MASGHEVQVKLSSARDLKNVNWRHGPVKPYAVAWVDPRNKFSTKVDEEGDTSSEWEETLTIPLLGPVNEDTILFVDVVHAGAEPDTKQLVGSSRLRLRDVVDDVGLDERANRTLQLKRPSGRPQGKVDVKVTVREPRYRPPEPYYATPPYGVPPNNGGYHAHHHYVDPYYAAAYAAPPSGYPYNVAPAAPAAYGQPSQPSYGQYVQDEEGKKKKKKKKNRFGGMGTGLAVGAVAGALGAFALAEGMEHMEDKIAEKVVDNLNYYDGDDF